MPFDCDPEDRASLSELMLVMVAALLVVPGLIWWAETLFTIAADAWEAFW